MEATVKVEGISALERIEPSAKLIMPKINAELIVQLLLFFRTIYRMHHAEAIILLHFCQETQKYLLHCPYQTVGGASVSCNASERFDGYLLVGDIHSHNDFGAFHSGIDKDDERDMDGIHITMGHLDQPYFTISCSVVVNGNNRSLSILKE